VNRLRTWLFLFFHTTKLPSQAVVRNFSLAYCMVTAKATTNSEDYGFTCPQSKSSQQPFKVEVLVEA
jgi:hypothetical protein